MAHTDTRRQLRSFGLLVGGIFGLIGLWPMVWRHQSPRLWAVTLAVILVGPALFRGQPPRPWALVVGVLLLVPALTVPRILGPVYRVWMLVGEALGWINTRILLGVVFYALITPMGLVMRLLGKNAMRRAHERDAVSYRVVKRARPGAHMTRQF